MIDLVIFDCDGTLVDSESIAARVTAELFQDLGVALTPEEAFHTFLGLDHDAARALAERRYGLTFPDDYDTRAEARMSAALDRDLRALPGIPKLLAGLDLPFCVASNSSARRLRRTLTVSGLLPYFGERVFSVTDVARGKPAPDLFLHAARVMGALPGRCLVIEDSVAGVTGAAAAGMRVAGFCGGGAHGPDHADRLTRAGAAHILWNADAVADLIALLSAPAEATGTRP